MFTAIQVYEYSIIDFDVSNIYWSSFILATGFHGLHVIIGTIFLIVNLIYASRDMLMDSVFEDKFVAPCVAGRKLVVVNETGDVFPCEMLDPKKYRLGKLRDYDWDLGRLLADSNSRSIQDWIVDSKCKCSWECSNAANIVWNPSQYPRLLRESVRNIGSGRSQ